jgi:hypothetical protein
MAVSALIVALATPSAAFASSGDDRTGAPADRPAAAPAEASTAVPVVSFALLRSGTAAAAATIARQQAAQAAQAPRPGVSQPARRNTRIRAQGGGQMAMMLITTAVGIAGTVYMLKYLKDSNDDASTDGGTNRVR